LDEVGVAGDAMELTEALAAVETTTTANAAAIDGPGT